VKFGSPSPFILQSALLQACAEMLWSQSGFMQVSQQAATIHYLTRERVCRCVRQWCVVMVWLKPYTCLTLMPLIIIYYSLSLLGSWQLHLNLETVHGSYHPPRERQRRRCHSSPRIKNILWRCLFFSLLSPEKKKFLM